MSAMQRCESKDSVTSGGSSCFAARHCAFKIQPCAEICASALQHDDAGVAIALHFLEIIVEGVDQRRIEGIRTVGAFRRDMINAVQARARGLGG